MRNKRQRIVFCVGYEGHSCGKKIIRRKHHNTRQKWCSDCQQIADRLRRNAYKRNRRKDPEFRKKECGFVKAWRRRNRKHCSAWHKAWRQRIKDEVYEAYGGYRCQCPGCSVTEPLFLTLDHVNNDGTKAVKQHGNERGIKMWVWIKKHNFPKGMFQVMCFNCNCGRARNGGHCPHLKKKF